MKPRRTTLQTVQRAIEYPVERLQCLSGVMVLYSKSGNFGDSLGPYIAHKLTGREAYHYFPGTLNEAQKRLGLMPQMNYMIVGSILEYADEDSFVWGPGFISESAKVRKKPHLVCAVRGEYTRRMLISQGVDCPEVYGDPTLLLPRLYRPSVKRRYALGIIPHYVDSNHPFLDKFREADGVKFIDVYDPVEKVIQQILSCEAIASSSLHGIVAADAYGIPSAWIHITDLVVGGGFKFRDYFTSVGRADTEPLVLREDSTISDISGKLRDEPPQFDPDRLLDACPLPRRDGDA